MNFFLQPVPAAYYAAPLVFPGFMPPSFAQTMAFLGQLQGSPFSPLASALTGNSLARGMVDTGLLGNSFDTQRALAQLQSIDDRALRMQFGKKGGKSMGLKPRARIRAFSNIGSEPAIMLTGPVDVTEKLLKRAKMKLSDIDLFELNEAFASVVLRYMQAFDISHDRINVNGGAIAMGHPLGATGAMILGTVLDELERRDLNTALVTLCIGAGMGTATIIERV